MKISLLLLFAGLLCNLDYENGYVIEGEKVIFNYLSDDPNLDVYVSGNFNQWTKNDPQWQLKFNPVSQTYQLIMSINDFRTSSRSFYEFTFRVDDRLVDADPDVSGVIFCAGYGHRYVVRWD